MTRDELLQLVRELANRAENNTEPPGTPEWIEVQGMISVLQALVAAGIIGRAMDMGKHTAPFVRAELHRIDAIKRIN